MMSTKRRFLKTSVAVVLIAPLTGCVNSAQGFDFVRTEFARITSDIFGQVFLTIVQAISPFGAA